MYLDFKKLITIIFPVSPGGHFIGKIWNYKRGYTIKNTNKYFINVLSRELSSYSIVWQFKAWSITLWSNNLNVGNKAELYLEGV